MRPLSTLPLRAPRSIATCLPLIAAFALTACRDRVATETRPPEENRFSRTVVADAFNEPMQMDFDAAGRIYVIERTGGLRRFDPASGEVSMLGTVPVFTGGEGGLLGVLLDREFESNRRLFLYYTAAGDEREARLSRFTVGADDRLDMTSEIVMLRWEHEVASHMGGGMAWEPGSGNLFLTTGENSVPTQYTSIHWSEPGGRREDSQRTAANTNDLRGKILRIHPEEDGSFTIPEGNLFPPGTPQARPEIYTMGNRNPWRISVDSVTGALHWGEIGPDAGRDSAGIGPRGYDEFNVATGPGNFGWPYFIGYNLAYNRWDDSTRSYGPPFDPADPMNRSPNNDGLRELPPAQPPVLAYPYAVSEEYPQLNSGGRAAVGGPVFRAADFEGSERSFPSYYEGKWFVVDFVRNWIMVMTLNPERTAVEGMERLLPAEQYNSPIDMEFGPEGDLYVLEYGRAPLGRLSRISYRAGNRPPVARVAADRTAGALPFRVSLSADGTVDHDGDDIAYEWLIAPTAGGPPQQFDSPNPTVTFTDPGAYTARLTVRDPEGASDSASLQIHAGNDPPGVNLKLTRGNRTFFFPDDTIEYATAVSDREDGVLGEGGIAPESVVVTLEYLPAGLAPEDLADLGNVEPRTSMRHVRSLAIIAGSDCAGCHFVDEPSIGPSFREVARRYAGEPGAAGYLANKIIAGGRGAWGDIPMPSHPGMTAGEAATLADYMLSLGDEQAVPRSVPAAGSAVLTPTVPVRPGGAYLLRAAYTDRGAAGATPIRGADALLLRHPRIAPETADSLSAGMAYSPSANDPGFIVNRDGAHLGFRGVDLTGIEAIEVGALTRFYTWSHFIGGSIEVRLDSAEGPLIGGPVEIVPPPPPVATQAPARQGAPSVQVVLGANLEPPTRLPIAAVRGIRDVYLVVRNPRARESDALMIVRWIEFMRGGSEP